MTAKEFLAKARYINQNIQTTQECIERLLYPHPQQPTERGKSSVRENREIDKRIRLAAMQVDLQRELTRLMKYKEVIAKIASKPEVSNLSRVLLKRRYILGEDWRRIARYLDYETSYVRKELFNEAIREIEPFSAMWSEFDADNNDEKRDDTDVISEDV